MDRSGSPPNFPPISLLPERIIFFGTPRVDGGVNISDAATKLFFGAHVRVYVYDLEFHWTCSFSTGRLVRWGRASTLAAFSAVEG